MMSDVEAAVYEPGTLFIIASSTHTFAKVSVEVSIAVPKVSDTLVPSGTLTSFGCGIEAVTLGAFETVNDDVKLDASPKPDGSFAPGVTVTVMTWPPGYAPVG